MPIDLGWTSTFQEMIESPQNSMHASIATMIIYLDDIAFEPIAQSQKSNSCKWPGIHRNWLAVVLLVVYCVSVIWIVLLSNGRRAGQYVQILTICPSPFKRSVDCKRLNLASTECSTKYVHCTECVQCSTKYAPTFRTRSITSNYSSVPIWRRISHFLIPEKERK